MTQYSLSEASSLKSVQRSECELASGCTGALIAYILERFHGGHRCDLPGLIVLAREIESVHGNHSEAPKGLADFLDEVAESLEEHMQKEEQILFPMIRNGGHPMISHPIAVMRMEHDDHASNLDNLLALTNGLKAPEGACGSCARFMKVSANCARN